MTDDPPIDVVLGRLKGVLPSGDTGRQWSAQCPAHADSHASLGVGVTTEGVVLLKCYAGCPPKAVVAALGMELRDLFPSRKERKPVAGVTVAALAFDKRIPVEFLRGECGLADGKTAAGGRRVLIPYRDEAGGLLFNRARYAVRAKDGTRQPKGTRLQSYGRWRLPAARKAGNVLILVEGESDAWTLWYHGYPALGVPGADAVKGVTAADLDGFDVVYVWRDGKTKAADVSGEHFVARMAARVRELRPGADVRVICDAEHKDPNEIRQKLGDGFRGRFDGILAGATTAQPAAPDETPPPGDPVRFPLTDLGNARRLVARHGRNIRYCHPERQWYVWDGTKWHADDRGAVPRWAKATVLTIFDEAKGAESSADQQRISQWAVASQSARHVRDMMHLAQSEEGVPVVVEEFDTDPWVLNCPNGTVDLKTGTLRPHRREDLLVRTCPVEFDPDARCPEFEKFLARVFAVRPEDPGDPGDADLIGFVRRLFGYCLTGDVSAQILPIFWGSGANGKSALLKVVRDVMGKKYSGKAPRGLLMIRKTEQHPAELMTLRGTRLMVASETGQDGRLNEELIKDLTSEDVRARGMRENFGEGFDPTAKLLLCTNHPPRIPEGGDATWRRLALVPFRTKFWNPDRDPPGPDHLRQDKELPARLRAEHRGILAYLVRGCLEWRREGLRVPEAVSEQTREYRADEDWVARFLADCCVISNAGGNTLLKDVYARYVGWAEGNGGHAATGRKLKAGLLAHNVVVRNGTANQVTCYGLTLRRDEVATLADFDE